jgi:PAS domain S-box-containing protein
MEVFNTRRASGRGRKYRRESSGVGSRLDQPCTGKGQQVSESSEYHSSALDNMLEGCQIISFDWRYLYLNNAAARHGGRPREELLGRTMMEMHPGIENTEMFARLRDCMEKRIAHRMENEFTFPDGTKGWFELTIQPVPEGILIVSIDITDRRKTDEALRESEERYRNVVERANDGICIIQDGIIRYINPPLARIWGGTADEIIGTPFIRYIHPDSLSEVEDHYAKRMAGEHVPSVYEIVLRDKDGNKISVEISGGLIIYGGKPADLVLVRDITERKKAEAELELRSQLLDSATDSIFVHDFNGNFIYMNETACRFHGYSKEEFMKMKLQQIVAPERVNGLSKDFQMMLDKGQAIFESAHQRKDGSIVPVEVHGRTLEHGDNKILLTVIRDIAERKQLDDQYRTIIRTAMDGFWLVDTQGYLLDVNDAYCDLTGYSRDELLGMSIQDLEADETAKKTARRIRHIIDVGYDRFESCHRCKDGSIVAVEVSVNHIKVGEGRFFVFIRDITNRKLMEESLRKSERRLREAQALGRLGTWEYDLATQKLEWSDEVYELFERDKALGPPTPEEEARYYAPEEARRLREFNRTVIKEGKELTIDSTAILPSGKTVFLNAWIRPVKDESGRVSKLFGTIHDITERKKAAAELKKYSETLEEMVEERTKELRDAQEDLVRSERLATLGQFSGSISHELRNPLGVIDSSIYYLKTKLRDADAKVQEHLDRIKSSVGSATAIIQSLLDLTRMKEPQLARLDLIAVVSDVITTSEVPATVKVIQDFADQQIWVNADGEQLRMAFKNIVSNALDAMDDKGVLTVRIGTTAGGQAEVSFADTGPGIAPENLDKVFQPLFSTKAKGIGFGLSITKMIVDRQGGTIEARSEAGKGATLIIQLPPYTDKAKEV